MTGTNDAKLLAGRTVLITGGGSGLGQGISLVCGAMGANVVIAAPRPNGGETAAEIAGRGGEAFWAKADIGKAEDIQAAVDAAVTRYGGLDAVVHNAIAGGSGSPVPIEEITDELWAPQMLVSVRGAYRLARAARPHLAARKGRFVVMTSPAAMEGSTFLPAYAAVKGALRGFYKSLAVEWGPLGINVTCVSPLAATSALKKAYEEQPHLEARLKKLVPLGWVGDPEGDVAPGVAFLLTDLARYVDGQTLVIDGGRFTNL